MYPKYGPLFCVLGCGLALSFTSGDSTSSYTKLGSHILHIDLVVYLIIYIYICIIAFRCIQMCWMSIKNTFDCVYLRSLSLLAILLFQVHFFLTVLLGALQFFVLHPLFLPMPLTFSSLHDLPCYSNCSTMVYHRFRLSHV